jgi:hypothetical protein
MKCFSFNLSHVWNYFGSYLDRNYWDPNHKRNNIKDIKGESIEIPDKEKDLATGLADCFLVWALVGSCPGLYSFACAGFGPFL